MAQRTGLTVLLVTAVALTTIDQARKTWVQTSGCRLWRKRPWTGSGRSCRSTLFQCVLRVSRSPEGADGRFRASVSAAKNPVPGAEKVWWRELRLGAVAAGSVLRLKTVNVRKWNQGWARPSRSNCSDHSAGASRKVATPMPRGSRPSTAALTRAGAMNAIDIVMLT